MSGDWVLISTKIQRKPIFYTKPEVVPMPKSQCPFENPQRSGHKNVLLWLPRQGKSEFKDWWLQVLMNKYSVVLRYKACSPIFKKGIFEYTAGNGVQELVVVRDHARPLALMTQAEIRIILDAYLIRYHALRTEPCVEYILILHNSGSRAGASVPHPHSQIFAVPIIPPDVGRSLEGSKNYFHQNKRCVHCDILKWEMKERARIIYHNRSFVALAPYASKVAYEIRIFPVRHESRFEIIGEAEKDDWAEAVRSVFSRIYKVLKNPDYNFFIHTAPPKDAHSDHYHWHMEILPRVATWGGLELGAGIEVIKVAPEETAKLLRK